MSDNNDYTRRWKEIQFRAEINALIAEAKEFAGTERGRNAYAQLWQASYPRIKILIQRRIENTPYKLVEDFIYDFYFDLPDNGTESGNLLLKYRADNFVAWAVTVIFNRYLNYVRREARLLSLTAITETLEAGAPLDARQNSRDTRILLEKITSQGEYTTEFDVRDWLERLPLSEVQRQVAWLEFLHADAKRKGSSGFSRDDCARCLNMDLQTYERVWRNTKRYLRSKLGYTFYEREESTDEDVASC